MLSFIFAYKQFQISKLKNHRIVEKAIKSLIITFNLLVMSCMTLQEFKTAPTKEGCYGSTENFKKTGEWKCYSSTGQLQAILNFKFGVKEGLVTLFFENGQLDSKSTWKNGLTDGYMESYDRNGHLMIYSEYKEGILSGANIEYLPQGQKVTHCHFLMGKRHGSCKTWYPTGVLRSQTNYIEDKLEGQYQDFYENGHLRMQAHFQNGKNLSGWKTFPNDRMTAGTLTGTGTESEAETLLSPLEGD